MKLTAEQLITHLKKQIAPLYIISGDEILLVEETCDQFRQLVQKNGFSDRQIFHVTAQFNWHQLLESANSFSLFAKKELIELRITTGKIDTTARKILNQYLENPSLDKILLLITPKIERSTQQTKWFKGLEEKSVFVPIWPITKNQLPYWIKQRLQKKGLQVEPDALNFLVNNVEGNLLAAKQAIEKLKLLYSEKNITLQDMINTITDSAHFNIFDLVDYALSGNTTQTLRVLSGLRAEGVEPILMLWALARATRSLITMKNQLEKQKNLSEILRKNQVWEKRKLIITTALKRLSLKKLLQLLQRCSQLDKIIKGAELGNIWNQLERLCIKLSK